MKFYIVTVAPREPWSYDEGLTLRVILPARSKDHAVKRVLRYMDGAVTGCKVHKDTGKENYELVAFGVGNSAWFDNLVQNIRQSFPAKKL